NGKEKPFLTAAAFLLILLSFVPNWLIFYPGSFTYDTQNQVFQVAENRYDMFHPLLHTLLIRFCISMFDVVGSLEKTAALYAIIQMTLMALCFALISASISRISSRCMARLTVCFFVLYPTHMVMASNCTKDVLFGGFLALFVTLCIEQATGNVFPPKRWALLLLSGTLACLFRNNMIYAMIVWTLVLFLNRRRMKRLCAAAAAIILLSQGINAGLGAMTNAAHGSVAEMLSVPVQQLARAMAVSPESFTQDDLDVMDKLFPDKCYEDYTPSLSDPVKNHMNVELIQSDPLRVARLWLDVGMRCPNVYFDAFFNLTLPSLYPYSSYKVAASYIEIEQRGGVWTLPFGQSPMVSPARFANLRSWLRDNLWETGADNVPLIRFLFNTGAIFWLCGACVLHAAYKGRWRRLCVLALPVLLHMTFLLGPVMQGRYLYPFVCLLPALLLTAKDEAACCPSSV
ncbi:MAG: DUF6020 family protein, partial [Clostridia bacterium]|nr:DUF6020 family protein [Clostridia bacterium]